MSENYSNSSSSSSFQTNVHHTVIFWIFLMIYIPSVSCSCVVFIQVIRKRLLKNSIHNDIIMLILFFSFLQVSTEHPLLFSYLYHHESIIQSDRFCQFWASLEYFFNGTILMLICYASIERYLLVFHSHYLHRHLVLLHYIPMIFFVIYPLSLYLSLIYFHPCINQFDFKIMVCGGPCYLYEKFESTLDIVVNLALPLLVCTCANLLTLVRVLYRRYRMAQRQIWRKHRRLIIQLLAIVLLHDLAWLPAIICLLIMIFSPVSLPLLIDITLNMLPYGFYLVVMFYPIVTVIIRREFRTIRLNVRVRPARPPIS